MNLTIIDTDILIDAARQVGEALDCLQQIETRSTLGVSVITQMELFVGCRNKTELLDTEQFLKRFQIITLDEQICHVAIDLLRQYRLSRRQNAPSAVQ